MNASARKSSIERAWAELRESLARYRAEIGVREEAVALQREWLGDLRGKRVLEIGCGAGNILTMEIAQAAGEYVGVDLQADQVRRLQEKLAAAGLAHARAQTGDVLKADGTEGVFDVIYAGSVLHAFADIDGAARVFRRLLKPGGVLVAWEPMNTGWAVKLIRGLYRPFQPNRKWHHPLTLSDVKKWGDHFSLGGTRGLLGWSKWGYPLYLLPGCRSLGVWVGRQLSRLDSGRKSLRGCHQVVMRLVAPD